MLRQGLRSRTQSRWSTRRRAVTTSSYSPDISVVSTASRGIGLEFTKYLLNHTQSTVFALARDTTSPDTDLQRLAALHPSRLQLVAVDLEDQQSVTQAVACIHSAIGDNSRVDLLINSAAVLGGGEADSGGPERSLDSLNRHWLRKSFEVNVFGHVMLTQGLAPLLRRSKSTSGTSSACTSATPSRVVNISARVGSIGDNRLGGWYSYRMSKAALNMFTKTLALEMKRANCIVISLHPGTTDTGLSQPFQKNVKSSQLFSTEYSVQSMMRVVSGLETDDTGKFLAYDGTDIVW